MKKVFTFVACALLGLSAMAEDSFTYYTGAELVPWAGKGSQISTGAFMPMNFWIVLTPGDTPELTGRKITRVEMPNQYCSNLKDITAWTSTNKQTKLEVAFVTPNGQIVTATTDSNVMTGTFNPPVEIPANGLAVGYQFTVKEDGNYMEYEKTNNIVIKALYRTYHLKSMSGNTQFTANAYGILPITVYFETTTPTGVNEIVADDAVTTYYDLTGRQVANPQHGIFIKKVGNQATKIVK